MTEESGFDSQLRGVWRKLLLGLLFGVLVYSGLTFAADWEALRTALSGLRWAYIPIVIGLASMNYIIRFGKWHFFLHHLRFHVPLGINLILFLAGLFMSVTPGKMGEVLKSYLLKRTDRTPMSKSAPVVFAERLTDLVALLALAVLGGYALSGAGVYLVAGTVVVIGVVAAVSIEPLHRYLCGQMSRVSRLERLAGKAEQSLCSARALVGPKPLVLASAISIPAWFCECVGFWVILHAFGILKLDLAQATGIYALAAVVGALSMLPGGLGATELTLTGLLSAAGVARGQAVAATLVVRLATLWYAVAIGAIFLAIFRLVERHSANTKVPFSEVEIID
jgi:uncharacterized protein (TIRG00374 family)